jgi:hypothetical protein
MDVGRVRAQRGTTMTRAVRQSATVLSGTLAHMDVRGRAYRDVFTAVPESAVVLCRPARRATA